MVVDPVAGFLCRQKPTVRISLVIFGAVMIHLSLGTYHTFGNILPYMASYMRNYTDHSIRLEQLMWIPMFQGCFPLAMVIGGCLATKLGARPACALGCFLTSFGVLLSTWTIQHSYVAFLITYGFMFGLGQGMAYVIAVATVINWAPNMVGFGSGIVAAGFGISASIFAPIQTQMVNPQNYPPTKDGYFTQNDLLLRVPSTFFNLSIVYFIMQCIGLIFICDPPSEFARNYLTDSALIDMAWLSKRRTRWMSSAERGFRRFGRRMPRADVSYSRYGYVQLPLLAKGSPKRRSSMTFGETFIADDFFMAMAFSVGSVANSIARVVWGILTDRTSFQITLSVATSFASILLFTMPATALLGKYIFLLWLTLMFICMGATHALFITAVVRCFGSRHKSTNYGTLIFSTTLSGIFLALLSQHFLEKVGYTWAFVFTAAFPFIAFVLTAAIRVTPQGHLIV